MYFLCNKPTWNDDLSNIFICILRIYPHIYIKSIITTLSNSTLSLFPSIQQLSDFPCSKFTQANLAKLLLTRPALVQAIPSELPLVGDKPYFFSNPIALY